MSLLGLKERPARILSVGSTGLSDDLGGGRIEWSFARAAAEVKAELRHGLFDHIVSSKHLDGRPVWPTVRWIRTVRIAQKWSLVSHTLSESEEALARSLGVTRIFASTPDLEAILELAADAMKIESEFGAILPPAMPGRRIRESTTIRNLNPSCSPVREYRAGGIWTGQRGQARQ